MVTSEREGSLVRTIDPESLPVLLRRWRLASGLSQEALAEKAGLSVNGVAQIETGKRTMPRAETLRMLADALDLDAGQRLELALAARPAMPVDTEPLPDLSVGSRPVQAWIPLPRRPLIGRDAELASILHILQGSSPPLLTLVGPGGVGKTRLALAAARAMSDAGEHVVWVDLASTTDSALILAEALLALGLNAGPGDRSAMDTLVDALHDASTLLVLDNCEHVRSAAGKLSRELLQQCPRLRILAASRTPLHVRDEQVLPVAPLTLPDPDGDQSPASLASVDAVALFVSFASAIRGEFRITPGNAAVVGDICRQLDGLPLALELAAARMRVLSPSAMLAMLDQHAHLLAAGAEDAPARHQTLDSTVRWSYDLLSPSEQRLFRHLGVFAGGATMDAITAICGEDDPLALLQNLETLVDHSLLVTREQEDGDVRFFMLETIRAFALERLIEAGEEAAVRDRHAAWYRAWAEAHIPLLDKPDEDYGLRILGYEYPNLRVAVAWYEELGDARLFLGMAATLGDFWDMSGRLPEARVWLGRALAASPEPTLARMEALTTYGNLLQYRGMYEEGATRLQEAVSLAQSLGSERLGHILLFVGTAENDRGNYEEAKNVLGQSIAAAREVGDKCTESCALSHMGIAEWGRGDFGRAARLLGEGLEIARKEKMTLPTVLALLNLGLSKMVVDDPDALPYIAEAFTKGTSNPWLPRTIPAVAVLALRHGDARTAAWLFGATDACARIVGDVPAYPERILFDDAICQGRDALGEEEWERLHAAGMLAGRAQVFESARGVLARAQQSR